MTSRGPTGRAQGLVGRRVRGLQRLMLFSEETRVYPGHHYGDTPTSTIAHEIRTNRFLRCATFAEFRALRERKRT